MAVVYAVLGFLILVVITSITYNIRDNKRNIKELEFKFLFLKNKKNIKKLREYYRAKRVILDCDGTVVFVSEFLGYNRVKVWNLEKKVQEYQSIKIGD